MHTQNRVGSIDLDLSKNCIHDRFLISTSRFKKKANLPIGTSHNCKVCIKICQG